LQWANTAFLTVQIPSDKQGEDDGDEEGVLAKWIWLILEYEYLACAIYRPFKILIHACREEDLSNLIKYSDNTLLFNAMAIRSTLPTRHFSTGDPSGIWVRMERNKFA